MSVDKRIFIGEIVSDAKKFFLNRSTENFEKPEDYKRNSFKDPPEFWVPA
jgi:hypothetical protein